MRQQREANCIIPGNHYQLFYWDNEWVYLGQKEAIKYSIDFNNVPIDGLYWLKCLEGGKEERIFTYENGTQIWW